MSPAIADYPFNDISGADAIIRTCDEVSFYVHKLILSLSSSFFRDMFTVVHSRVDATGNNISTSPSNALAVSEDSRTMDCLLRMVYPGHRPTMEQPSLACNVWKAARKYHVRVAEDIALERLHMLMPDHELGMFAIACDMQNEEEARRAANAWLKTRSGGSSGILYTTLAEADFAYVPEMNHLSAGNYLRLLHHLLQPRRGSRFCRKDEFVASQCEAEVNIELLRATHVINTDEAHDAFGHGEWDTILRSSDGVEFRVHQLVLRLSKTEGLIQEDKRSKNSGRIPTYSVGIESSMLRVLLYICYPLNTIQFESVSTIVAFLRLALAYNLAGVIEELKRQLLKMVDQHSVRLYFVGVQLGWDDLTSTAARYTVGIKNILECIRGIDLLRGLAIPELENVSASALYRLLKYHRRAQEAVIGEVDRILPSEWTNQRNSAVQLAAVSALGMPCTFEHISVPIVVTGSRLIQARLEERLSIGSSLTQLCQGSKKLGNALKVVLDDVGVVSFIQSLRSQLYFYFQIPFEIVPRDVDADS